VAVLFVVCFGLVEGRGWGSDDEPMVMICGDFDEGEKMFSGGGLRILKKIKGLRRNSGQQQFRGR
jgi:hypothetical protein